MLIGTIYFSIKPTVVLIERLERASEYAKEVLGESLLIPAKWGGPQVEAVDIDSVKIVFIAHLNHGVDEGFPELVSEVFGCLNETVDEFDRWWTCDVFERVRSLADMLVQLRKANRLKSLSPTVTKLSHFQDSIKLTDLPSESDTSE